MISENIQNSLDIVDGNRKFNKFVIAIMSIVWLQIAYLLLGGSYIFMNPMFKCVGI